MIDFPTPVDGAFEGNGTMILSMEEVAQIVDEALRGRGFDAYLEKNKHTHLLRHQ
jgi:hypothetical protein